jgi:membrane-associated phospholipid phosphatase
MKSLLNLIFTYRNTTVRRNAIILALFAIGLAMFLSIYDGVREHEDLATLDNPLLAWAITHQNSELTAVMRVVTDVMSPIGISTVTILGALIWAYRKKDYWRPALLVGAVAFAFVVSAIIKTFTARARPTLTDLIDANAAISYSFPSGHTIGVAVLLLVLGYFFCVHTPTPRRITSWLVLILSGISLVAFSRIYLGYHWLTDVTASVGLAIIILAIVIAIDSYFSPQRRRTTSRAV